MNLFLQRIVFILLFVSSAGVTGCTLSGMADSVSNAIPATVKESADRAAPDAVSGSLSSQPQVVWDQWVRKSDVQVYLRPKEEPAAEPTVLFFPFLPKIDIAQGRHISRELSRMIWQAWLAEELFPIMEFADYTDYYTPERAIALARQRGADLAVGGYITNYMAGGTVSDTYVALQLNIYDAVSGEMVWSMAHAGMMQSELTKDYILFSARTRLPSDPTGVIMQALARDMSAPIHVWLASLKKEKEAEEAQEQAGAKAF